MIDYPAPGEEKLLRHAFRCMTTDIELLVDTAGKPDGKAVLESVETFFRSVETRFSRFLPDSELSVLNRDAGSCRESSISEDLAGLVQLAQQAARASHGIFDPTVVDALEAAGYDRSIDAIREMGTAPRPWQPPSTRRWQDILLVYSKASGWRIQIPAGVRLDLGGIAKGWAADRASRMMRGLGPGLVNAGGDLRAWGDQPGAGSQQGWLVAVDHPEQPGADAAWLSVRDRGVATSSILTRRWSGGHHLIDPRTGRPARTDLVSVTVVGPDVVQAEVAAKVVLVLGREAGFDWLAQQTGLVALAAGSDGQYYGSPGIASFIYG